MVMSQQVFHDVISRLKASRVALAERSSCAIQFKSRFRTDSLENIPGDARDDDVDPGTRLMTSLFLTASTLPLVTTITAFDSFQMFCCKI